MSKTMMKLILLLATQKNLNGGDREAALRVKGVIGLEWNRMAKIVGLSTACERILSMLLADV